MFQNWADDQAGGPSRWIHPQEMKKKPRVETLKLPDPRNESDDRAPYHHGDGGDDDGGDEEPEHDDRTPECDGLVF